MNKKDPTLTDHFLQSPFPVGDRSVPTEVEGSPKGRFGVPNGKTWGWRWTGRQQVARICSALPKNVRRRAYAHLYQHFLNFVFFWFLFGLGCFHSVEGKSDGRFITQPATHL